MDKWRMGCLHKDILNSQENTWTVATCYLRNEYYSDVEQKT